MQKKIMQISFCDLHSAVVYSRSYLKLYEVANDKIGRVSWFNDFIGRFSRATKPRPQKLANFVHPLTCPLFDGLNMFDMIARYCYNNCGLCVRRVTCTGHGMKSSTCGTVITLPGRTKRCLQSRDFSFSFSVKCSTNSRHSLTLDPSLYTAGHWHSYCNRSVVCLSVYHVRLSHSFTCHCTLQVDYALLDKNVGARPYIIFLTLMYKNIPWIWYSITTMHGVAAITWFEIYGFLNSEASIYKPENVVLHQVNFSMSQHAINRPSQARECHTAVQHYLACGGPFLGGSLFGWTCLSPPLLRSLALGLTKTVLYKPNLVIIVGFWGKLGL